MLVQNLLYVYRKMLQKSSFPVILQGLDIFPQQKMNFYYIWIHSNCKLNANISTNFIGPRKHVWKQTRFETILEYGKCYYILSKRPCIIHRLIKTKQFQILYIYFNVTRMFENSKTTTPVAIAAIVIKQQHLR